MAHASNVIKYLGDFFTKNGSGITKPLKTAEEVKVPGVISTLQKHEAYFKTFANQIVKLGDDLDKEANRNNADGSIIKKHESIEIKGLPNLAYLAGIFSGLYFNTVKHPNAELQTYAPELFDAKVIKDIKDVHEFIKAVKK